MDLKKNKTDEELKSEKQKKIIERVVDDMSKEDQSLYYAPTVDIVRIIMSKIETEGYLSKEEALLMEGLDFRDIQNFLSYASNCC